MNKLPNLFGFFFFSLCFIMLPLLINKTFAQIENFDIGINSSYKINEEGTANVSSIINIQNKTKYNFTSAFDIKLQKINDVRNVKAYYMGNRIQTTLKKDDESTVIEANLGKRIYGENKTFEFTIDYETSQFAKKTGDFWEIYIPSLQNYNQLSDYNITISVPQSFGKLSISKPENFLAQSGVYVFKKEVLDKSGVFLLFGSSQTYKIDLDYHLSNSNLFPIKSEIAVPPSTNYQDIIIKNISPKPVYIYEDSDGNWLAVYQLAPNQKLDVKTTLLAKVYTTPKKEILAQDKKNLFLEEKKYWETNNVKIKKIASNLKTAGNIYNYVVKTLGYNFSKIIGENQRLGAANALAHANSALCLEFTDLFIALARSAGIPARSVEGFAYSENVNIKPLSILKDTLHAWPEYYNNEKQAWIMIDPTWGNTTGGSDYFNSLDLDHITFVIKGKESDYPISPGGYKINPSLKDVNVSLDDPAEFKEIKNTEISNDLQSSYLPFIPVNFNITVKNNGNTPVKNEKIKIISDLFPNTMNIDTGIIPPYGAKSFAVKSEKIPVLTNKKYGVRILFGDLEYKKDLSIGFVSKLFIYLTGGGIFAAGAILIAAVKTRRLSIPR